MSFYAPDGSINVSVATGSDAGTRGVYAPDGSQRVTVVNMASLGFTAGDFVLPLGTHTLASTAPSTSAAAGAFPFCFPEPTNIDRLKYRLITQQAGAELMTGIYTNSNGRPATLISDLGTQDLSATSGSDKEYTVALELEGYVWVVVWMKNVATQATLRCTTVSSFTNIPVPSGALTNATNGGIMGVAGAYPASMPATAPAVVPQGALAFPTPLIRIA